MSLLPDLPAFTVFLIAALAVGISPGPGMMYAVARGIGQGTRGAVVATAGLATGSLCNCLVAALGLSALISASTLAYDVVRYAGALYLLYLAVKTLRGTAGTPTVQAVTRQVGWATFYQAVITNIVNPKSALFYLSFVPQFIDPVRGSLFAQFVLLGLIFNVLGNTVNLVVAIGFGRLSDWLARRPGVWRVQQWLTASILTGLALHLLLASRR